jgi:hypothetical protein
MLEFDPIRRAFNLLTSKPATVTRLDDDNEIGEKSSANAVLFRCDSCLTANVRLLSVRFHP